MKTLKDRKRLDSELLKERYLQCFGARASNATMLQGVVRDLIGEGISRQTLVAWAVAGGCTKGYASSLLSRIFVSLGMRERQKGAGRKPSPDALELLSHARSQYGDNFLRVLYAACRAGKAQFAAAHPLAENSRSRISSNCTSTISLGTRPGNGGIILTNNVKCRRQPRMQRKETVSQR